MPPRIDLAENKTNRIYILSNKYRLPFFLRHLDLLGPHLHIVVLFSRNFRLITIDIQRNKYERRRVPRPLFVYINFSVLPIAGIKIIVVLCSADIKILTFVLFSSAPLGEEKQFPEISELL